MTDGLSDRSETPWVFGDRLTVSEGEYDVRSYAPNEWEQREQFPLRPLIVIDDVLATQSLVMRMKGQHGRSLLTGEKRHGFAALNAARTNQNETYDDSLEEYLSARIAKVAHDQWAMRIRFRQNQLSEDQRKVSYFDDYSFSWLRNGNLQAWYGNYALTSADIGVLQDWRETTPIDTIMLDELHQRLEHHMSGVFVTDMLRIARRT